MHILVWVGWGGSAYSDGMVMVMVVILLVVVMLVVVILLVPTGCQVKYGPICTTSPTHPHQNMHYPSSDLWEDQCWSFCAMGGGHQMDTANAAT